jgi:hypothetical protein
MLSFDKSEFGRIFTCHRQAKTALFGATRFRASATPPPQGAACLASQPLQSLARQNSSGNCFVIQSLASMIKVTQFFQHFMTFCFSKNAGI